MSETYQEYRMGWIPDFPDARDYTPHNEAILPKLQRAKLDFTPENLPSSVDLRDWCPMIEDQKDLGSCTANAGVALVEYFEKKAFGKYLDASRLFLYKTTRNLLKLKGDTGASLRSTIAALIFFGAPPEEFWPYDISRFDVEPSAFCYAFGSNYQAISYFRLDPPNTSRDALLTRIKSFLAQGLPSIFGFSVYDSINQANSTGRIPFPTHQENFKGGHAVMAVGYDDQLEIKNSNPNSQPTKGALMIRNSWGTGWGEKGYGWLPYDYVLHGLAVDWWSLIKSEWIDTESFGKNAISQSETAQPH